VNNYIFEIPAGIEQIESLKTEVHLFIFDSLPSDPSDALDQASLADARFKCRTLGAENRQGNRELNANWRIDRTPNSVLHRVASGVYRPTTPQGMQQVRAEVMSTTLIPMSTTLVVSDPAGIQNYLRMRLPYLSLWFLLPIWASGEGPKN
jgi:hypothetical protein